MSFYKDVNSTTPTDRPDVTDVKSVIQSLTNLLSTKRGEVPFIPDFGINIDDRLFDLMDAGTKLEILTDVFDAVDRFEPRVDLRKGKSSVIFDESSNSVSVDLFFNIIGFSDDRKLFNVTKSYKR